jgi:hypothetical protein
MAIAFGLLSIILMADSCSGASTTNGTATASASQSSAAPTAAPTPIADIPLSGQGQTATQAFPVVGGLTLFNAHCACGGNFAVTLLDSNGKDVDIPINVIGAYTGSVAEGLGAGNYILKVDADAAWTITVSQPRHVSAARLPQTYSGHGQLVKGPFSSSGGVRLVAQHKGTSNFSVEVRGDDGQPEDIPINEIGNYNGSTIAQLSGGSHWLGVNADGDWTITVSNP